MKVFQMPEQEPKEPSPRKSKAAPPPAPPAEPAPEPEKPAEKATEKTAEKTRDDAHEKLDLARLHQMTMKELLQVCKKYEVEGASRLAKQEMIFAILQARAKKSGFIFSEGVLDVLHEGYGFLRSPNYSYVPSPDDIY